jgi:type II secretory pathway component GspD/PulD (secretin)
MFCSVYAEEDVSIEGTVMNNQKIDNCLQKDGITINVIKLNYVNAEDVVHVLAPLFSESAKIIPYKPTNSVLIKGKLRSSPSASNK